jgi:hypothetical protein
VIDADELARLCRVRSRLAASYRAWRTGGLPSWRERRELHQIASELAFHRWRVLRGLGHSDEADNQREAEYLQRLQALCRSRAAVKSVTAPDVAARPADPATGAGPTAAGEMSAGG